MKSYVSLLIVPDAPDHLAGLYIGVVADRYNQAIATTLVPALTRDIAAVEALALLLVMS